MGIVYKVKEITIPVSISIPPGPELNIDWPIEFDKAITSEKDAAQPTFTEFEKNNPFVYGEI